jgi:hypothetical protein
MTLRLIVFAAFAALGVSLFPVPASGQSGNAFNGSWEWKSQPNRQKEQSAFWVTIKQKGNRVTGDYAFAGLVDGENDGADSSSVLFVGTVKGNILTIEFDPTDIHGIDEMHPRYKRPRVPAVATLQIKNGKLQWSLTKGKMDSGDLGVPQQLTLSRSR